MVPLEKKNIVFDSHEFGGLHVSAMAQKIQSSGMAREQSCRTPRLHQDSLVS